MRAQLIGGFDIRHRVTVGGDNVRPVTQRFLRLGKNYINVRADRWMCERQQQANISAGTDPPRFESFGNNNDRDAAGATTIAPPWSRRLPRGVEVICGIKIRRRDARLAASSGARLRERRTSARKCIEPN